MDIAKIKDELKDFKSNRKATIKLLSLVSEQNIFMGKYRVFCGNEIVHLNEKYGMCWICCRVCFSHLSATKNEILINSNTVEFHLCNDCTDKKLCHSCLRETSRCSIIHTRKLLCYKILLQHKFPKDIIKLITKKVK